MDLLELTSKHQITTASTFITETDIKSPAWVMPMRWDIEMRARGNFHRFTYTMGSGHCTYPEAIADDQYLKNLFYEARLRGNTGFMPKGSPTHQIAVLLTHNPQPNPPTVDLLQALLADASSHIGFTPGQFITYFGHSDIDEGLAAYKKCERVARFFTQTFSLTEFDELLGAGETWDE